MKFLMNPMTMVVIYLTIWWTALFAILPLGNVTYHEAKVKPPAGGDPGAPMNPNLKKKAITTTWVSAVVMLVLYLVLWSGVISLPELH